MEEAIEGVSFGALICVSFSPSPSSGMEPTCRWLKGPLDHLPLMLSSRL